ncbi:MAG: UPF0262 family protein [Alphaproteobacteria bacterium]|nr:UPF0262 family protein [Alphaproteobacteria bacterium]
MSDARNRLIDVRIDEASLAASSADAEHERRVAIFDLLESNQFAVEGEQAGPYALTLSIHDGRLALQITGEALEQERAFILSLSPFRKTIKDYFFVCDSYYAAIRNAAPQQIEAIDMGRRALHNEGSALLMERLKGKIEVDHDTARRLFTLICALHARA